MYLRCPGVILVVSWQCLGGDPVVSQLNLDCVLVVFRLCLGVILVGLCLVVSWGGVLVVSSRCVGSVLVVSWWCLGCVLLVSW